MRAKIQAKAAMFIPGGKVLLLYLSLSIHDEPSGQKDAKSESGCGVDA
jgi:hypothetical protein